MSNNIFQTAEIIKKVFNGRKLSDIFRELENSDNLNILKALTYSVLRNYDESLFYFNKLVKKKNKRLESIIIIPMVLPFRFNYVKRVLLTAFRHEIRGIIFVRS